MFTFWPLKAKSRASEEFAKELKDLGTYGHSDITFVIGGSGDQ